MKIVTEKIKGKPPNAGKGRPKGSKNKITHRIFDDMELLESIYTMCLAGEHILNILKKTIKLTPTQALDDAYIASCLGIHTSNCPEKLIKLKRSQIQLARSVKFSKEVDNV